MSSYSTQDARIIDPVLSKYVQGYRHPERIGHILFPRVEVTVRGGHIIEFGRESFRRYNSRRTPGSDVKMISIGHEGKPFSLVQDALDAPVPREVAQDAKKVPGIEFGRRAVDTIMNTLTLNLEYEQAELAQDPGNYPDSLKISLSGADLFTDAASDPEKQIEEAKEAVRRSTGVTPNVMAISKPIFNVIKNHGKIMDKFKYTTSESITAKMLANLFGLEDLAVGSAVGIDSPEPDAPFEDVWGNNIILAYAPQKPTGLEQPSFGYTYTLTGHPFTEQPVWDRSIRSHVYGVTYERAPVLTGISSGFLIQNVIAEE